MSFNASYIVNPIKIENEVITKLREKNIAGESLEPHAEGYVGRVAVLGVEVLDEMKYDGSFRGMAISNSGKYIVVGQSNGIVKKMNMAGRLIEEFKIHEGSATSIEIDERYNYIISAGYNDNTVKLTNDKGVTLWTFTGHTGSVLDVAFSQSDRNIYSGGVDGTIRKISDTGQQVWSTSLGSEVNRISLLGSSVYAGCNNGDVVKIQTSNGAEVWRENHNNAIFDMQVELGAIYIGQQDGTVKRLNATGTEVWSFNAPGRASAISFSKNYVYAGYATGLFVILDKSGNKVLDFNLYGNNLRDIKVDIYGNVYLTHDEGVFQKLSGELQFKGYRLIS